MTSFAPSPLANLLGPPPDAVLGTESLDRALRTLRDYLDLDVAFVSEFRQADRVFRHVDARDASPVQVGDTLPLELGYCQRVVDGRLPELIADTQQVPAAKALPETSAVPIGCHLSVPIRLADGRLFGTLCCFGFTADPTLGARDLKMMRAFGALLGLQIDKDLHDQQSAVDRRAHIDTAMSAGEPSIVFQPIFDLRERQLAGLECLSRFSSHPVRPPNEWFADAASAGMAARLETAAIRNALTALPSLPASAYLAVNCSPATLFDDELSSLLRGSDLERVVLEITEHAVIDDYAELLARLAPLRNLGLRIAIDDAGAGYSSLRHVLHLQPELIKLDRSLVHGIDHDRKRRALASALIAFAHETKAHIVAEGVETEAELRMLEQLGAHFAQGFFLGRPTSLAEALRQPPVARKPPMRANAAHIRDACRTSRR